MVGDAVAVLRPGGEGLQDQQIEGARKKLRAAFPIV